MTPEDKALAVLNRKKLRRKHLADNYYDEWKKVAQSYYCERDMEQDDDGEDDPTQTSIATPNTYAYVRRVTARITAQIPAMRFRHKVRDVANPVSRTLMYYWDKGKAQRQQKMHVTQAKLFGWSVKAWSWMSEEWMRTKRVNPFDGNPETLGRIAEQYEEWFAQRGVTSADQVDPILAQELLGQLIAEKGRGGLLNLRYLYKGYHGPKSEVLFIGDCYPEPYFESLQTSRSFIVERRRDADWFRRLRDAYKDSDPELSSRIAKLFEAHEHGSVPYWANVSTSSANDDRLNFRSWFAEAQGKDDFYNSSENMGITESSGLWTVTEEHVPGENAKVRYVAEDGFWLGEFDPPHDLEGRIPFTDLVFEDNLVSGIGDSTPRILRGLQDMISQHSALTYDVFGKILRPVLLTSDRELYENPELLKRGKGFRLAYSRDPQSIQFLNEAPALASAGASLSGDQTALQQQWQMGTGESNMSLAANLDPAQSATATGARILAYNADVITTDMVTMYTESSLKPDAELMFLMARAEMTDPVEFEGSSYNRDWSFDKDSRKEEWMRVEPALFQEDGEMVVEVGSTLAAEDEANMRRVMTMWQMFSGRPDVNQQHLIQATLTAMGEGPNLHLWAPQQPPPPPPPQPKANVSISVKSEDLGPYTIPLLEQVGFEFGAPQTPGAPPQAQPSFPQAGQPAGGPPPFPPGGPPPPVNGGAPDIGMYAASQGVNPPGGGGPPL